MQGFPSMARSFLSEWTALGDLTTHYQFSPALQLACRFPHANEGSTYGFLVSPMSKEKWDRKKEFPVRKLHLNAMQEAGKDRCLHLKPVFKESSGVFTFFWGGKSCLAYSEFWFLVLASPWLSCYSEFFTTSHGKYFRKQEQSRFMKMKYIPPFTGYSNWPSGPDWNPQLNCFFKHLLVCTILPGSFTHHSFFSLSALLLAWKQPLFLRKTIFEYNICDFWEL